MQQSNTEKRSSLIHCKKKLWSIWIFQLHFFQNGLFRDTCTPFLKKSTQLLNEIENVFISWTQIWFCPLGWELWPTGESLDWRKIQSKYSKYTRFTRFEYLTLHSVLTWQAHQEVQSIRKWKVYEAVTYEFFLIIALERALHSTGYTCPTTDWLPCVSVSKRSQLIEPFSVNVCWFV